MSDIPSTSFNDNINVDQNLLLEADSKLEIANRQITQLQVEKSENEKKFKEELEKYITEKNQIDQLKHENKCISDLCEKQKEELNNRYVSLPNKINVFCDSNTCCQKKCNLSNGTCISNNGYRISSNRTTSLFERQSLLDQNNAIGLFAEYPFTKEASYDCHYSLFYYEITMKKEEDQIGHAFFGFEGIAEIVIDNSSDEWEKYQKFDWNDGDIFGCGLVFPPKKKEKIQTNAYVFFTKNGNKIGRTDRKLKNNLLNLRQKYYNAKG
uniref:SPRY domain-containing protein n=1 Tax=Meloidogyne hapla TaxID=6305 RepID=A0A1I8BSS0_MELHA